MSDNNLVKKKNVNSLVFKERVFTSNYAKSTLTCNFSLCYQGHNSLSKDCAKYVFRHIHSKICQNIFHHVIELKDILIPCLTGFKVKVKVEEEFQKVILSYL